MKTLSMIIIIVLIMSCIAQATFMGVSDTSGNAQIQAGDGYDPRVAPFTASASGTVDSLWKFIATTSSNRHVRLALYNYATRAFICSTYITIDNPDTGWIVGHVNPTGQTVTSGNKYIITATTAGTETDLQTYRVSGSDSLKSFSRAGIEPWPSTITLSDLGDATYSFVDGISYNSGPVISATISITDTNGTSLVLSANLSGGSAPYDSVVYYFSSIRANVVDLSARESLYTAASDPQTMTIGGLTRNTKYYFRVKVFDNGSGDTTAIDSITTLNHPSFGTITTIDTTSSSFISSVAYTAVHISKLALVWDDSTGADSSSGRKDSLIITADFTNPDSGVALGLSANSPYCYWWRVEDDGGTTWSSRYYVRTNSVVGESDCPSTAELIQAMINAGFVRVFDKNGGSDSVNWKGIEIITQLNDKIDNLTTELALARAAADSANARAKAARDSLNSLRPDIKLAADTSLYVPPGEWEGFRNYYTDARALYFDNINHGIPSSTDYTADRAKRIDSLVYLDASISARPTLSQIWLDNAWTAFREAYSDIRAGRFDSLKFLDAAISARPTLSDIWQDNSWTLFRTAYSDAKAGAIDSLRHLDAPISSRPTAAENWGYSDRILSAFNFDVQLNSTSLGACTTGAGREAAKSILLTPSNKIYTDTNGLVNANANVDTSIIAKSPVYWTHEDSVAYQGALNVSALIDSIAARGYFSTGSGPIPVTFICLSTSDTTPVSNVDIIIRPHGGGISMARAFSRPNGTRIFDIDSSIYDVSYQKQGYSFDANDSIVVNSAMTETVWCVLQIPEQPPVGMCMINLNVVSANGDTLKPTFFKWTIVKNDSNHTSYGTTPLVVGTGLSAISIAKTGEVKSNSSNFQIPLYPNSLIKPDSSIYKFEITYSNATIAKTFIQVPDTTAFNPFGQ